MAKSIVLHLIQRKAGGGAEFIASNLNKGVKNFGIDSYILYLQNHKNENLNENEFCLEAKSLNPLKNLKKFHDFLDIHFQNKSIIIHTHLTWDFYLLALSNYKFQTKIHTEHMTQNKRRRIPFLNLIERIFYKRYSNIIAVSDYAKLALLKFIGNSYSKKTLVINNGIQNLKPKIQISKEKKPILVSIGSLTKIKGFDLSIKALSLIRESFYKYFIVGEGPELKNLIKLALKYNLKNKVKFLGFRTDINRILCSSYLCLFPSRHESFNLSALEALSVGLPIITSNVGGMKDVVQCKASTIANVEDPKIFSMAILENIKTKIYSESLRDDAISHSKKFTLEKMCFEYSLIYKKYLSDI